MLKHQILKQKVRRVLPVVSNPCAPYGARGLDSSVLIWHRHQRQLMYRFMNGFQTPISVVDWSDDGSILLAGSMTGEVLVWRFSTGECLLANRHARSYAPILGISWSPGGQYLAAMTTESTLQIWQIATRTCFAVMVCRRVTSLKWSLDGRSFSTNNGIDWIDASFQERCYKNLLKI